MKRCDWCNNIVDELLDVSSLGREYQICSSCSEKYSNNICIKCGSKLGVVEAEADLMGMCPGCYQEHHAQRMRKANEVACGVDAEVLAIYTSGIEFTEQDYERWVIFGQGNFTPEYRRKCRIAWLKEKLPEQSGWTPEIIENNINDIEALMDRYISKIINKKYIMVYYNPKDGEKEKIKDFVDVSGDIYIVGKA